MIPIGKQIINNNQNEADPKVAKNYKGLYQNAKFCTTPFMAYKNQLNARH